MNPLYYPFIEKVLRDRGKIILKRVYGDFTEENMKLWKKICIEYGVEAVIAWRETSFKNSSDMKMVTDIMEILIGYDLEHFVLVTGDVDFKELCRKILSKRKHIIGISCFENSVSRSLRKLCNEYIILENHFDLKNTTKENITQYGEILSNIVNILSESLDNKMNMGLLKKKLMSKDPTICENRFGFKTFKEFIRAIISIENTDIRLVEHNRGDYIVELITTES